MLGFLKDNISVGLYTGAIRLTKMVMGITSSLGVVFLPKITTLLNSGNFDAAKALLNKTIGFIIAISLPVACGLIVLSPTLIRLFCGDNYLPAIPTLKILSLIIVFISISYIFAQTMLAMGRVNITIFVGSISACTNLLVNFILIPHYSQNGAATATLIAESISLTVYLIISRRYLDSCFVFSKHSAQCLFSALIMSATIFFLSNLVSSDILCVLLIPMIGALTYLLSMILIGNSMTKDYLAIAIQKIQKKTSI